MPAIAIIQGILIAMNHRLLQTIMRFRLLFLALFLGPVTFGQGAQVRIPGTNCSLIPPEGFVLSREKSGFIDSAAAASVVVGEVAMPYDTLIDEFSEKNFLEHAFYVNF